MQATWVTQLPQNQIALFSPKKGGKNPRVLAGTVDKLTYFFFSVCVYKIFRIEIALVLWHL